MPENHTPATQPKPGAEAGEFNFAKPAEETPRIRRRSLKAKSDGLIKPATVLPPAALELKREAPPLSTDAPKPEPKPVAASTAAMEVKPTAKSAEAVTAPPRTTPSAATATVRPVANAPAPKVASAQGTTTTAAVSPHGTRPATLYYSSGSSKEKEETSPMKTTTAPRLASTTSPTAGATTASTRPAATASTSAPTNATSAATRTAAPTATTATPVVASTPRSSGSFDYRANVERQSREQKSVGNILAYVVYALAAFLLISAGLAGYGGYILSKQIQQQSVTVSDLDARYAAAVKDLNTKLTTTQDTLTQAQAQIARQQDLIVKQQDDINRLIAATNESANGLKAERQARQQGQSQGMQETANLRARVRDLEYKVSNSQKY